VHETIGPDLDKAKRGAQSGLRVAIQAHFHYPELVEDFLERIAANKASCDLLLTTNDVDKAALLGARTTSYNRGTVKIRIVPNRGRDIAPLLTALGREIVRDYDVIGHLHGKRSSGVDATMGETWREFLWQHLLGPRYPMMDIALAHFAENEKLGLLFPEEPHLCDWDANREIADDLARGAGLERPLPPFFEFPVGTMFWARTFALAPLVELALTWDHYPEEPIANDGTVLHALERLLPFSARKRGYGYATVHIPGIGR
jgi:lipopolysaccharide biosynthesis protein